MLHGHVVNQFLDENRFADSRAPEQSNLSALQERLNQVHDLDARLKHLQRRGLLVQQRRWPVDLVPRLAGQRPELVHRFAEYVHHAAEGGPAHGHADALAQVVSFHPAHQAFCRLHCQGAHAPFAQVLLHLGSYVNRLGNVVAVARDAHGVVDRWQVSALKLHVQNRPDDLHDSSHGCVFFRHAFS